MSAVTLLHNDCFDALPALPADSVQFIFADLPYATVGRKTTKNYWDVPFDLQKMWKEMRRVLTEHGVAAFTASQPFASALIASNLKLFRYDIIWDKVRPSRHLHANRMPMLRHEHVLIFYKTPCVYNPLMVKRDVPIQVKHGAVQTKNWNQPNRASVGLRVYTHKFPTTIVSADREFRTVHPTQKPVKLLQWLIETYTNRDDTVLDFVAGSGTTAIAALRTGRNAICIEKDASYYDIMCKRVEAERAQTRLAI